MKKILSVWLVAIVVICLFSVLMMLNVFAASASLWFTDPSVTVGNNVNVIVDVKGDNIGGYQMNISYNTAYLKFVSASGNTNYFSGIDNGGVIKVSDMADSGARSKMSFTLTFKALKTGTAKLTPSDYKFFDGGGDPINPGAIGNSTININAVPVASSDATLKSLAINAGTLVPAFSAATTEYTAAVDFGVTSMTVSAVKNHNGASVYVSGNDTLNVGENIITITVTAENGTKKTYTIKVTRGKNPLSSDIFANVAEGVVSEISLSISSEIVPAGFETKKITIADKEIDALYYDERALPAVYLLGNENVVPGLYFINIGDMTVTPFGYLSNTQRSLMMLDVNLAQIPDGYEVGKFKIGEVEVDALVPTGVETPNHCLVYSFGVSGEKTLYVYDPVENTYQRYLFAELGKTEDDNQEEGKEVQNNIDDQKIDESEQNNSKKSVFSGSVFKWTIIVIAVLVVILGAVGIVLAIRSRR